MIQRTTTFGMPRCVVFDAELTTAVPAENESSLREQRLRAAWFRLW